MWFDAVIEERPDPKRPGIWAGFALPAEVAASFRTAEQSGRVRKRIPVCGTLAGQPFRGSVYLRPSGEWEFITGLELRGRAHVGIGDAVAVEMSVDAETRAIAPPADLAAALAETPGLTERWQSRPWSDQREFLLWIDSAKRPETRDKRIRQVAESLGRNAGLYREPR